MENQRYQTPSTEVIELRIENTILIISNPNNNPNSNYDPLNDLGIL